MKQFTFLMIFSLFVLNSFAAAQKVITEKDLYRYGQSSGRSAAAEEKFTGMALEAELADRIDGNMTVSEDPAASDGKYVWEEGRPATGGGQGGFVEFRVTVPEAGTYALWGRISSWDPQSDSFWVTWQPVDPENPHSDPGRSNEYYWDLNEGPGWSWQRVNGDVGGQRVYRTWTFDGQTETVLRVWVREDGSKLDALFITPVSSATDERAAGVRLPTPRDRERQRQ